MRRRLDALDLEPAADRDAVKDRINLLQRRLAVLQRASREHQLASVVVIEGWATVGKRAILHSLVERLDPRGFLVQAGDVDAGLDADGLPWMWPFWQRTPARGAFVIYHRSWFAQLLEERLEHGKTTATWSRRCADAVHYERLLVDDGTLVTKIFLHLDRASMRKRLETLRDEPRAEARLARAERTLSAWKQAFEAVCDGLARTEAGCPWHLVGAFDGRLARLRTLERVAEAIEGGLERRGAQLPDDEEAT
ncbi:MAG: hypothetical protein AAGN46_15020 [Acidobacteriota bacterium]